MKLSLKQSFVFCNHVDEFELMIESQANFTNSNQSRFQDKAHSKLTFNRKFDKNQLSFMNIKMMVMEAGIQFYNSI